MATVETKGLGIRKKRSLERCASPGHLRKICGLRSKNLGGLTLKIDSITSHLPVTRPEFVQAISSFL